MEHAFAMVINGPTSIPPAFTAVMAAAFTPAAVATLSRIIGFALFACLISFLWAPFLTHFLYKHRIVRQSEFDATLAIESRKDKANVPVMGGLLIIITVTGLTLLFNWDRRFTWVPIGVMLIAAFLGAIDDLLNIFGTARRNRKIGQTLKLIRIHKDWKMRVWYAVTLPWATYKRLSLWLGSHPGKGVHVHEKLLLQFIAGAIGAWWIYFKLGNQWRFLYIPFHGFLDIGWWMIPLIIFVVMFTANSVNIADGMDGLAGGMLITTFSALTLVSWLEGLTAIAILNATAVGVLITYTYFNVKPARFQMGDVGSLGIGALLAINTLVMNFMVVLPLFAFMFYVEALSVVVQIFGRYALGRRIFKMAPLHHHFELSGWSEEKTIMRFWIIHIAFVFLAVWVCLH
jgi:phospho-N-acetylmuramoyl-pentapeptide-transferase